MPACRFAFLLVVATGSAVAFMPPAVSIGLGCVGVPDATSTDLTDIQAKGRESLSPGMFPRMVPSLPDPPSWGCIPNLTAPDPPPLPEAPTVTPPAVEAPERLDVPPPQAPVPLSSSLPAPPEVPSTLKDALARGYILATPEVPVDVPPLPWPDIPVLDPGGTSWIPVPSPMEPSVLPRDASLPPVPGVAGPSDGEPALSSPPGAAGAPRAPETNSGSIYHPSTAAQAWPILGPESWPPATRAAVMSFAVGALLLAPALALYSRLTQSRVLQNPLRRALMDYVETHPGATCAAAARDAGLHYTTAERHLRILARFGFVVAMPAKAGARYFENHGRFTPEQRRDLSILAHAPNAAFLRAVGQLPGAGVTTLAASLGMAKSTASRRAGLLLRVGVLVRERQGFAVAPHALATLETLGPAAAPGDPPKAASA